MDASQPIERKRFPLAFLALFLCCAWIAAGALFKLLEGSPNELPPLVRRVPLDLGTLFPLLISIELFIVAFALLAPRHGFKLVVLQLLVFLGVLAPLIAEGADSCGCFGSKLDVDPRVMAGIDGALLVFLLSTRPWRAFTGGWPVLLAAIGAGVAASVPWLYDRQISIDQTPPVLNGEGAQIETRSPAPTPATHAATVVKPPPTPVSNKSWVLFDVAKWEQKPLSATPLAKYVDMAALPQDGLYVFYRESCERCAAHLMKLWTTEQGQRPIVLVRVTDEHEGTAQITKMPEGPFVTRVALPAGTDYVIQTPAELEVAGGVIVRAVENMPLAH